MKVKYEHEYGDFTYQKTPSKILSNLSQKSEKFKKNFFNYINGWCSIFLFDKAASNMQNLIPITQNIHWQSLLSAYWSADWARWRRHIWWPPARLQCPPTASRCCMGHHSPWLKQTQEDLYYSPWLKQTQQDFIILLDWKTTTGLSSYSLTETNTTGLLSFSLFETNTIGSLSFSLTETFWLLTWVRIK